MTIDDFVKDEEFVEAIHCALRTTIEMILANGIPFIVSTDKSRVRFDPQLPKGYLSAQPIVIFDLAGYTLESAEMVNDVLSFEAGFGEDSFASTVSVPLGAILQVTLDNMPIFLNMAVSQDELIEEEESKEEKIKVSEKDDNVKRSMEAILNNPKNKKLIKR